MKYTFLFPLSFIFTACSSEPNLTFPESVEKVQTDVILEDLTEETEEFNILEEELVPLNYYQKAREKHSQKDHLPSDVVLHNSNEIFDYTILYFEKIIKVNVNWFLCKYLREEGEVSEEFYITFDYNGNQLDAVLVNTLAIDLSGEVTFTNDTSFLVTQKIDEIKLDENGNLKILSSRKEEKKYTISKNGRILFYEPTLE